MHADIRKGMAEACVKRIALGCVLVAGGVLSLLAVVYGKPALHPAINLLLMLMLLGMGIVLPIGGIISVVKAITSFRFRPPRSPEQTMMKFMKELLGGSFVPGNPAVAFLCLTDECQARWGDWKSLKTASRLYTQSLKQRYNDTTLCYEIGEAEVTERASGGSVVGVVRFEIVLPGGPGDKARRFSSRVEFSLIESAGHWHIAEFRGGPSTFHGKATACDLSSPDVQAELRTARLLIGIGVFTLAMTIGSLLVGLRMPRGDAAIWLVFVVPFFAGFATLAFIGNGLAKRGKYR
jgi:hypothetical protein